MCASQPDDPRTGELRIEEIPNTERAIRGLVRRLGGPEGLVVCYEAGPCGCDPYRLFGALGVACDIVAPALIPRAPGARVKTDRRDAKRLLVLHRAGALTFVYPPTPAQEGLRDLVRCREDLVCARRAARHRVVKQLLRYGHIYSEGKKAWTKRHIAWVRRQRLSDPLAHAALEHMLAHLDSVDAQIAVLDHQLDEIAARQPWSDPVRWLCCFRGITTLTALGLLAELASADVYDPSTDRWTATGPMTERRYQSGVAALPDGRALVAGGWRWPFGLPWGAPFDKKTAELLDPNTLTWSKTGALTVGRGDGATLISTPTGTPVYLGGLTGSNNGGWLLNEGSVEAYDAATGTWHFMAPMGSKRHHHTALALANGTLLAFGGSPFPKGSERLVPLPPPAPQNPAPSPQPTPQPTPAAPRVVAGKLSFAKPLPHRVKPSRTRTITVKLRCTGGPCRDRLALRRGARTLARVDVKAAAGATVTVKLKLSTANYRKLRHRKTAATLVLSRQDLTRWVTVTS